MIINLILIICIFILLFKVIKGKENFKCTQTIVNYNDYCNECDNVCDPNSLYCDTYLNKCRWNNPQESGSSCVKNEECLSNNCYYDESGKNTGIGYCI